MTESVDLDTLLQRIIRERLTHCSSRRLIVALAGAPGSGKSTLAERLASQLNAHYSDRQDLEGAVSARTHKARTDAVLAPDCEQSIESTAVVVPMDGFHLDNTILKARNQQSIKGSPVTFDVAGFNDLLLRLGNPIKTDRIPDDLSEIIYFPLFDRAMDLARVAAGCVGSSGTIVLVEGNYLLLQQSPWHQLRDCFDLSVFLDVPLEVLEQRLIQRWLDHGLDADKARERALSNDIPNAKVVLTESIAADVQFKSMR